MFQIAVAMKVPLFLRGDRSIEQMAGFSIARLDYQKLFREVMMYSKIYGTATSSKCCSHYFDHGSSECSDMSLSPLNSSFFCDFGCAGSMALSTLDLRTSLNSCGMRFPAALYIVTEFLAQLLRPLHRKIHCPWHGHKVPLKTCKMV